MSINYQVKQGDSLSSIAYEHGFFAETLWNLPENAELKRKREDQNVLMPGDVVYIPDKRLKEVSETTNDVYKFRCKNTPKKFKMQLLRLNEPVSNMEYEIVIDGKKRKGKTGSDGWLTETVLPNAKKATITLEEGYTYEMNLGYLDPVDEVSGIQGRLKTLGYYEGRVGGTLNEETIEALKNFQYSNDLEVTGEADAKTKNLLKELAGD